MEWADMMRRILREQVIPAVQRAGIRRLRLPGSFGPQDCLPQGRRSGPRENQHLYPEMGCFLSGVTPLWIADRLIGAHAGDILLIPPNVKHSQAIWPMTPAPGLHLEEGLPVVLWLYFFPFGAIVQFAQTRGETGYTTPFRIVGSRHLLDSVTGLLDELEGQAADYEVVAQGLLLELLGRICRAPLLPDLQAPTPEIAALRPGPAPDLVSNAQDYLRRHYDRPLTLQEIARHLFVSPSHLSYQFKQATGRTVMAYLTELRIATAKRLLETSLTVTLIAQLVGFEDPYYFSRVFRHMVGESPRQFRSHLTQGQPAGQDA